MATDKQSEAARLNGAKSHGPVTPEGKAASSQNARKHGFSSPRFLYDTEDAEEFARLLTGYRQCYAPADRAEDDFVYDMAVYRFRLQSVRNHRAAAADLEAARQEQLLVPTVQNLDDDLIAAQVLLTQGRNGESDQFCRYENHFDRLFHRAFRNLLALQQHRHKYPRPAPSQAAAPEPVQNEPAVEPRLVSINEAIALGHIPSLRPMPSKLPSHSPNDPETVPDDAAA